jgi:hypothetical protein
LVLLYGNTGKEPARNVGKHEDSKSVPLPTGSLETALADMRHMIEVTRFDNNCALARDARYLGIIYPGTPYANSTSTTVKSSWITDGIVKGLGFVIVEGCFVYETMSAAHKSEYCFFYNTKMDEWRPQEQRSYLLNCPIGNDAD